MAHRKLIVGNKNYSSWSLRGWLIAKRAGAPFEEEVIPLHQADSQSLKDSHSPAGLVPILRDDDLVIWDTLAIAEYLNEQHPEAQLWPVDRQKRAVARSVTSQMHSGFMALRTHMPMNIRRSAPTAGRGPGVMEDIDKLLALWRDTRARFGAGGDFLFGDWCIADAFFTPPASRFVTYGIELNEVEAEYQKALLNLPEMLEWSEAAKAEPWSVELYDL